MIQHVILFLAVGWLVALAYFARECQGSGQAMWVALRKLGRYTVWSILLVAIMYGLEVLFIAI